MDFGINAAPGLDLLRQQLMDLLALARGGSLDPSRARVPFSVLLPDFEVNQATLEQHHSQALTELSEILLDHPKLEIEMIVGRASQTGNETNNVSLSEARAATVADAFDGLGIYPLPPTMGLGSSDPIQDIPNTESELNRSVEIKLWYDFSYHPSGGSDSPWDKKKPDEFWRAYMPGSRYDRAALIVKLVYENIDDLYQPIHDTGVDAMLVATAWQDVALVHSRALLGYYKQTGSDASSIAGDIAAFNQLLSSNGLSPSDFTGTEISDAEHFFTGAVLTMSPGLGLVIGPPIALVWEGGQGVWGWIRSGDTTSLEYNMEQFIGADMAGLAYGMSRLVP